MLGNKYHDRPRSVPRGLYGAKVKIVELSRLVAQIRAYQMRIYAYNLPFSLQYRPRYLAGAVQNRTACTEPH
jgi:hypothetical protein